jgi:hypothetical protein
MSAGGEGAQIIDLDAARRLKQELSASSSSAQLSLDPMMATEPSNHSKVIDGMTFTYTTWGGAGLSASDG